MNTSTAQCQFFEGYVYAMSMAEAFFVCFYATTPRVLLTFDVFLCDVSLEFKRYLKVRNN